MGNRSRFRYRHRDHVDPEPVVPPTADEQAEIDATADAFATMESDPRSGIDKLMGLVLRDRERALSPETEATLERGAAVIAGGRERGDTRGGFAPTGAPFREPTAYETAILFAMGNRMVTIDMHRRPPVTVPLTIASGGVFMGIADDRRVPKDRERNKRARAARSGRRRRHYGRVYRSPFGYHVTVPGINDHVVDAEVVEDEEVNA